MIELEDGIQSRPGFASMAIGASQEEGAVRCILRRGNTGENHKELDCSP
jgi:hypothetical protein